MFTRGRVGRGARANIRRTVADAPPTSEPPAASSARARLGRWLLVPGLVLAGLACSDDGGLSLITGPGVFDPAELDFEARTIGASYELPVRMTNPGVGDLRVTDVRFEPASDVFAARLASGGTLRGALVADRARVDVRVLYAPRVVGTDDSKMIVEFGEVAAELPIRAEARQVLDGMLGVDPDRVAFGPVELGRRVWRRLRIQNIGDRALELRDARVGSTLRRAEPGVTPLWVTRAGEPNALGTVALDPMQRIEVDLWFAPRLEGPVEDSLQLVMANGRVASVGVTARGQRPGSLRCGPDPLDFGWARRGQSVDRSLRCVVEDGAYTVRAIRLDGPGASRFSVVEPSVVGQSFTAGSTVSIALRFAAEGLAAPFMADAIIESEHGDVQMVGLVAEVRPPPPEETAIAAELLWDTGGTDLDLHLVRSGAMPFETLNDCHFRVKNPDWGEAGRTADDPFLDRDDVDGGGPEAINLATPAEARYDLYVHYFGGGVLPPTRATLRLSSYATPLLDVSQNLALCGQLWHVATLAVAGGGVTVTPVGAVTDAFSRADCD